MTRRAVCEKFTLEKRIILSSMNARCLTTLTAERPTKKFSREATIKNLQEALQVYDDSMRASKCIYTSNPFVSECLARQSEDER